MVVTYGISNSSTTTIDKESLSVVREIITDGTQPTLPGTYTFTDTTNPLVSNYVNASGDFRQSAKSVTLKVVGNVTDLVKYETVGSEIAVMGQGSFHLTDSGWTRVGTLAEDVMGYGLDNKVRYIRISSNGVSTTDNANYIVNISAFNSDGVDVALGKANASTLTTDTGTNITGVPETDIMRVTDGSHDDTNKLLLGYDQVSNMLDLGKEYEVVRVNITRFHTGNKVWRDTKVEVSTDKLTWTTISDDNDYAEQEEGKDFAYKGSSALEENNIVYYVDKRVDLIQKTIDKTSIPSIIVDRGVRYIRLTSNGSTANTGNHLNELKVFDTSGTNVMNGITLDSSNCYEDTTLSNITNPGFTIYRDRFNDGNTSNYSGVGDGLSVFIFDMGAVHEVDKVHIWRYYRDGRSYHEAKVEVSKDGTEWMNISGTDEYVETSAGKEFIYMGRQAVEYIDLNTLIDRRIASALAAKGL